MNSALHIHSERVFREYEPHIATIISNYPASTTFTITSGSPHTFIARLRDALNGMRLNNWQSDNFTITDVLSIFRSQRQGGTFIFTHTPAGVYCGPPLTNTPHEAATTESQIHPSPGQLNAQDLSLFNAILVLKERGILDSPVRFVNVSNKQIEKLDSYEAIEFFQNDDEYIMI